MITNFRIIFLKIKLYIGKEKTACSTKERDKKQVENLQRRYNKTETMKHILEDEDEKIISNTNAFLSSSQPADGGFDKKENSLAENSFEHVSQQQQDLKNQQPQPFKPPRRKRVSVVAMAEGVQRRATSVDQMAQLKSCYNVKRIGSQEDSEVFMEEVHRRKSIVNTFLLPMVVTGFVANTAANEVSDRIVRSISVLKIIQII